MRDSSTIAAYRRILRAAEAGRGVRLSAEEVAAVSSDDAIRAAVDTERELYEGSDVSRETELWMETRERGAM